MREKQSRYLLAGTRIKNIEKLLASKSDEIYL
jgi:hypothetical protein